MILRAGLMLTYLLFLNLHIPKCNFVIFGSSNLFIIITIPFKLMVPEFTEFNWRKLPPEAFNRLDIIRRKRCWRIFWIYSMFRNILRLSIHDATISDKTIETLRNEWELRPWKSLTTTNLPPSPPYQCCFATKNPLMNPQSLQTTLMEGRGRGGGGGKAFLRSCRCFLTQKWRNTLANCVCLK